MWQQCVAGRTVGRVFFWTRIDVPFSARHEGGWSRKLVGLDFRFRDVIPIFTMIRAAEFHASAAWTSNLSFYSLAGIRKPFDVDLQIFISTGRIPF